MHERNWQNFILKITIDRYTWCDLASHVKDLKLFWRGFVSIPFCIRLT